MRAVSVNQNSKVKLENKNNELKEAKKGGSKESKAQNISR